jgi:prepilin-type N-terminal cleavage/methylation domain-containing protein/prepilin-type processing-associated H-X9-DG protein
MWILIYLAVVCLLVVTIKLIVQAFNKASSPPGPSRRGFTLIELLVVTAIIGVLVGITLPAVQMVREAARRTQCINNLKQVSTAIHNFESARGHLPTGINPFGSVPHRSMTFLVPLLPYIEQQQVWDQSLSDYSLDPSPFLSHLGMRTVIPTYQCPSDPESGKVHWTHQSRIVTTTSYLGVNGTNYTTRDGVFFLNSKTRMRDITDGASNTLMIGERPPSADLWYGWWYAGFGRDGSGSPDMLLGVRELNPPVPGVITYLESCPPGPYDYTKGRSGEMCSTLHFWSYHPGGANFALCDGSIRLIPYTANDILPALATRAGNEVVGSLDDL